MLKNKSDKKSPELGLTFDDILVCDEKKSKPFIEIIVLEGENVDQQTLGSLIGIFEISDNSEDSSYIVNYLISVIKKEYFSRPRRGAVESFETALHKANLALSKLAEHGNISWLGKLNILCAVFEKNRLHLSKTGETSAFLLRSKTLTDISEGLSEPEMQPNPLKTFDSVASGKLEIGDKLIVTTNNIFEIFSLEEIKKSALRFSHAELIQFMKTALSNELEKAAALIVDVKEKAPEPKPVPSRKAPAVINAFSQAAFARSASKVKEKMPEDVKTEIREELEKEKESFTSKKTGHIYIKESDHPAVEKDYLSDALLLIKDVGGTVYGKISLVSRKSLANFGRYLADIKERMKKADFDLHKEKIANGLSTVKNKSAEALRKIKLPKRRTLEASPEDAQESETPVARRIRMNILPSYQKLKGSLSEMRYEQKLYSFLIIIAIVIIPYAGIKISRKMAKTSSAPPVQDSAPTIIPLEQDKNVIRIETPDIVYSGNGLFGPIEMDGKFFAASETEIAELGSGERFFYPDGFGQARSAAGMEDLNLIFAVNSSHRIIAFSPVSKNFQDNAIEIPAGTEISDIKTYLTYIYLLDGSSNQIYRYPRAEGGFGAKTDWLEDTLDLSTATGMAINENIFVSDGKNVLKLFKHKKQDFGIEQSATPIAPHKVYVHENSSSLYVLDKQNARIVKLDESGNIIFQYYHAEIGTARDLVIDEENNVAYFSTPETIKSFKME